MADDYRLSHQGRGQDYHRSVVENPHSSIVWQVEREVLFQVVGEHCTSAPFRHLDFACGSGRILSHLAPLAAASTGVDVAGSMLEAARANTRGAELICADLTRDQVLGGREFDVITAFRFFPNAEGSLRKEAVESLARLLAPGGILVFNNHLNDTALLRLLVRLRGRNPGNSMTDKEVAQVCEWGGLTPIADYGIGVLPVTDQHIAFPKAVLRVEQVLTRHQALKELATDRIYVLRRADHYS